MFHRVMRLNDADGMANSVDCDETAPQGYTLFAQIYLSENVGSLSLWRNTWSLNVIFFVEWQSPLRLIDQLGVIHFFVDLEANQMFYSSEASGCFILTNSIKTSVLHHCIFS